MKKLRLLAVSGTYPPDIGGSEISFHIGLKKIRERGHEVVVVTDQRHHRDGYLDGIRIVGSSPDSIEENLDRLNKEYGFDVLLTQLIFAPKAMLWARSHNLASMYFVRGTGIKLDLSDSGPYRPDVVVANSNYTASTVQRRFHLDAPVVYPFIERTGCIPAQRNPHYITMVNPIDIKGGKVLRHLAVTFPEKEFLAVKGWTGLRGESSDWNPRMWDLLKEAHGDSNVHPPKDIQFADLANVRVLDAVDDIKEIFTKTKITLFAPFWEETFGRVALESLMCGIPLLWCDAGGVKETGIKLGGLEVLNPHMMDSWVKGLDELDSPEEIDKRGEMALSDAVWYDLDKEVDKIESLLLPMSR